MGHEHSKSKKKSHPPQIDSNKLNFTLKQIYFTAQLYRDRRKGQQSVREKELLSLFREPANKRVKDNEYQKAAAIVNDIKWIKAFELLMRYADLLKDNETVIQMSKGNTANINDLIPYVESVIWGCQKGSIECVNAFNTYIYSTFGPEAYNQLCAFTKVTPELKECFANVLPSEREVKLYLIDFCNKNGISMDSMNEIGHGLSLSALADFPDPNAQLQGPPLTTTIQTNQQIQQPVYPTYPGNFQQGYPQGGFPNNNFPQGGSSPGGFSQGGYPQGGFPQGGNNNGGFSQGGYPQGNFPQGGQQGGFAQGGQSLGGSYAQRGVNYPSFSNYPPSNFNANPLEPYKQAPVSSTQGAENKENLNMNAGGREMSFGQPTQQEKSGSGSGIGGYPDFQKFGGNVPGGQVGGVDPLDELDMRLRNIKGGL